MRAPTRRQSRRYRRAGRLGCHQWRGRCRGRSSFPLHNLAVRPPFGGILVHVIEHSLNVPVGQHGFAFRAGIFRHREAAAVAGARVGLVNIHVPGQFPALGTGNLNRGATPAVALPGLAGHGRTLSNCVSVVAWLRISCTSSGVSASVARNVVPKGPGKVTALVAPSKAVRMTRVHPPRVRMDSTLGWVAARASATLLATSMPRLKVSDSR